MTPQIINTPKGSIEFSLVGTGTPILFVHGGHSSCKDTFFHKGFDTRQFCLITPSRPGYGNTPLSDPTSPRQTAELFIALLDELNLKSVIVVGISAGGPAAIELAANFPEKATKLILISAVTKKWLTKEDETYQKAKRLFSPAIEKYSWAIFRFAYSLFPRLMAKTMFQEFSNFRPCDFTKEEVTELYGMLKLQRSKEGFINDLDQNLEQRVIGKVACPTIILHSINDNTVKLEHAEHAQLEIKNSILKTYNNRWGHLLWLGEEGNAPIKDTLAFIEN